MTDLKLVNQNSLICCLNLTYIFILVTYSLRDVCHLPAWLGHNFSGKNFFENPKDNEIYNSAQQDITFGLRSETRFSLEFSGHFNSFFSFQGLHRLFDPKDFFHTKP